MAKCEACGREQSWREIFPADENDLYGASELSIMPSSEIAARMTHVRRATLEEAERRAREISRRLRKDMPAGWGFILMLASFERGGGGGLTYLSTIERESAIRLLEEWIGRVSGGRAADAGNGFYDGTRSECWCCESRVGLRRMRGEHRSIVICENCLAESENV